jgi:hypothetical protein
MGNFNAVYDTFYKYKANEKKDDNTQNISNSLEGFDPLPHRRLPRANFKGLREVPAKLPEGKDGTISKTDAGLRPVPAGTVEVLAVFDTVA